MMLHWCCPQEEIQDELRRLRKKAKSDPRQKAIKVGTSLPQMGACRHFRNSNRWLRFGCCGKAFPCPTCHEARYATEKTAARVMSCKQCA